MLELSHVEDSRQSLSHCRSRGLQMCTMRFQLVGLPATRENNQFDDFTWKVQSPSNQIISLESFETIISVDGEASELSLSRHMCTALIMLIPTPMAMKGAWADFPTANKQYLLTFQSETCEKSVCFCFIKNCLLLSCFTPFFIDLMCSDYANSIQHPTEWGKQLVVCGTSTGRGAPTRAVVSKAWTWRVVTKQATFLLVFFYGQLLILWTNWLKVLAWWSTKSWSWMVFWRDFKKILSLFLCFQMFSACPCTID